jgi:hypothetical protein
LVHTTWSLSTGFYVLMVKFRVRFYSRYLFIQLGVFLFRCT